MSNPVVYGGLGLGHAGSARLGLGGKQPVQTFALPTMSKTALPYIAHLYDHNLVFKATLGRAKIVNKPGLQQTQNGGFQPITLRLASAVSGLVLGDVIRLTEDGDSTSAILASGNVETAPDALGIGPGATTHLITLTPWIAELGDADFNKTYATPTDVAQFVRDAVVQTAHCSVSPISCPDSGVKAMYDFQNTTALDAVHVAKQIAGSNWWYGIDAQGLLWFQPVVIGNPAMLTLKRGVDYNAKNPVSTILGMKTVVPVIGGSNPGDPGKIKSTYVSPGNIPTYGRRTFNPTPSYPNVTDQPTLDAIAASLGAQFDQIPTTIDVDCPALGLRLTPFRPGGMLIRLWDPAKESFQDPGGAGYSPTLILRDVQTVGQRQRLQIGTVPFADIDTTYEAIRVAQRTAVIAATAIPTPALVPQQSPPTTVIYGAVNATSGIKPPGGGILTIATATFTTSKTGTCQVLGAVDARMEQWSDYIPVPRRAVRATLSGGIYTGAWQELPFGLQRQNYDLSSASGIALAAGTYTVTIDIITANPDGWNQMHIFSGWVQVAVIA